MMTGTMVFTVFHAHSFSSAWRERNIRIYQTRASNQQYWSLWMHMFSAGYHGLFFSKVMQNIHPYLFTGVYSLLNRNIKSTHIYEQMNEGKYHSCKSQTTIKNRFTLIWAFSALYKVAWTMVAAIMTFWLSTSIVPSLWSMKSLGKCGSLALGTELYWTKAAILFYSFI